MRRTRQSSAAIVALIMVTTLFLGELVLAGCNAILGNESGTLGVDGSVALSCKGGQKSCAGTCVDITDPAVGCSGECTACASPNNGQAGCALKNDSFSCAIDKCNAQFDNCDDSGANGCETHITTRAHCGSCIDSCTLQFCERQGDSYVCSDSCDAPNISCGLDGGVVDCVDPKTDNTNCGKCGTACTVTNGTSTCQDGGCSAPACDHNYFLCGGVCQMATATACGSSCAPCNTGSACDVSISSATYGTCVPTTCTPSDHQCGLNCTQDCTAIAAGEKCVGGGCACPNVEDQSCGCPATDCTSLTGAWSCNAAMSPPQCVCKGGTQCPGSDVCCPSTRSCVGATCSACPVDSCLLDDGGCTNDLTRSPNCGACGTTCATGAQCCNSGAITNGTIHPSGGQPPVIGSWSCETDPGLDVCNP